MYLGIEIGGTKLQLGIGDGAGVLHALVRDTIVPGDGADGIRRQIMHAIPDLLEGAKRNAALTPNPSPGIPGEEGLLRGVGVGFGGPVDDATGSVIKSHQIAGWDGFALADWIGELTGLPAVLGNDADVAGLAEALFGAGKGLSPIFYITIGSGIGGGLIINGEIYRGCGRGAAEIGHLRFPGMRGLQECLEDMASGWGMQKQMGIPDPPTAVEIARQAARNDPVACDVVTWAIDRLAEGICHVIALLCPRRIVIGGGVAQMGDGYLFEQLRPTVALRVFKPFADCYDIVPAALGEVVVVHGALALARQRFG